MSTPNVTSKSTPQPTVKAKPAAPAKPVAPAANNGPSIEKDEHFFNSKPTAAQLAEARKQVAAMGTIRAIPLANKEKAAWLTEARALLETGKKGAGVLQDAEFFAHAIPQAESDAARDAVTKLEDKILDCEERAGLKPGFRPINPFRPINQMQKGITGQMDNPIGAIAGIVALPVAITLDAVDLVTRPVQVVAYPFEWMYVGARKATSKIFGVN